jgi:hypothetical protein
VVSHANTIHTALAYFALAAFLGHVFLATMYAPTRHAFRAMTQGWVRVDWASHHHPKWLQGWRPAPPPPALDGTRTAIQIVLGAIAALFASRLLFFALGANTTDKVTARLYDITAWPGVTSIQPHTAVRMFDTPAFWYLIGCLVLWWAADRMRNLRRSP